MSYFDESIFVRQLGLIKDRVSVASCTLSGSLRRITGASLPGIASRALPAQTAVSLVPLFQQRLLMSSMKNFSLAVDQEMDARAVELERLFDISLLGILVVFNCNNLALT